MNGSASMTRQIPSLRSHHLAFFQVQAKNIADAFVSEVNEKIRGYHRYPVGGQSYKLES